MTYLSFSIVVFVSLFFSAIFSGSETGLYSVKRSRLDLEVRRGKRGARLVRRMTDRRATILITLLIGNNLALELMAHSAEWAFDANSLDSWKREAFLMLVLTPTIFLFGELLPKDLYRRRPHHLMRISAPVLVFFRYLFWPLERALGVLTWALEKMLGFAPEEIVRRPSRIELLGVFAEGRAAGALEPHAEELVRNALHLRIVPVTQVMIPWKSVQRLERGADEASLRKLIESSNFTRLPVTDGERVVGYVHQLGVLQADAAMSVLDHLRPILFLEPDLSVDRALARLRVTGRRIAAVGTPEAPAGLVTLKDLVEEISGDLGGW